MKFPITKILGSRSFFRIVFLLVVGVLLAKMPALSIAAQMTPVFGPAQYMRIAGPPQTFTGAFKHCGTQQCQIVVVNGDVNGKNRISSASISLNGKEIIGPNTFNQKVSTIVKPVMLADENQLITRLASAPGSFITVDVECATSPVILSLGAEGVSVPDPATLLFAVPIINIGTAAAQNVQMKAITLSLGTLTLPSLPFNLGTILPGEAKVLDADFSAGPFTPAGNPYSFNMTGTYAVDASTYCFTLNTDVVVPPAAPGSNRLGSVSVPSNSVSGGNFPPQPPQMDEEVNTSGWTVPTAPFVSLTAPPSGSTSVKPVGDPPAIVFEANSGIEFILAGQNCNGDPNAVCAEPSGAVSGGGVIFATANWNAAYSTDGITFHQLAPTTIFPKDAIGFCCDQIVQYVPSIDRFIWLIQGTGGYRLATASPQDIISSHATAWTYWNLPPSLFGTTCTSFDYPDLSVGDNFLYLSWDALPKKDCGLQVTRIPLAQIQAGGTIGIGFTHPEDSRMAWGSHLTQNTLDEIFWAGHNDNTSMRVFSCHENSDTYSWRDVGVSSWANNLPTSVTPDGQDWLAMNFSAGYGFAAFPKNGVIGATRYYNQLWFAWSAGTDSNFPQAHIEMVQLNRSNNFQKDQQVQIWNSDYAFAYPALATNACTGEVGLSFEYGGNNKYYENHVVGFWGDFIAYITTGSDKGTNRFGDYVSIRQATPTPDNPGNLFAAFGFGIKKVPQPRIGTTTDVRYVVFGRPASSCEIIP